MLTCNKARLIYLGLRRPKEAVSESEDECKGNVIMSRCLVVKDWPADGDPHGTMESGMYSGEIKSKRLCVCVCE